MTKLFESLTIFNVFFAWAPPIPTNRLLTVVSFESGLGFCYLAPFVDSYRTFLISNLSG